MDGSQIVVVIAANAAMILPIGLKALSVLVQIARAIAEIQTRVDLMWADYERRQDTGHAYAGPDRRNRGNV